MDKADDAFRTIGELSREMGIAQHVLRYWETRFTQLRPLQRSGNRRYYRPADVALVRRIDQLLNREGYTVKGVQNVLASKEGTDAPAPAPVPAMPARGMDDALRTRLAILRATLARALAEDSAP